MPDNQSHSSGQPLTAIERPHCPRCHNRMMLARIMLGPPGFDLRSFECAKCDHAVTMQVANDPMQSDVMGWLNGELGYEK